MFAFALSSKPMCMNHGGLRLSVPYILSGLYCVNECHVCFSGRKASSRKGKAGTSGKFTSYYTSVYQSS